MTHTVPTPAMPAPPIAAMNLDGGAFSLPQPPQDGMTLVFFYRGVHCPVCKTQIEELAQRESEIREAGLAIAAVSMDGDDRFARQQQEWNLGSLNVGHGLTEDSARSWGLYLSDKAKDAEPERFAEPAIAVLKQDGTLYALYVQNTPFARPRVDDLLQGIGFVMKNDYPIRGTA